MVGLQTLSEVEKASLMFALGGVTITIMFFVDFKCKQRTQRVKKIRKADRKAKHQLRLEKIRTELAHLRE